MLWNIVTFRLNYKDFPKLTNPDSETHLEYG